MRRAGGGFLPRGGAGTLGLAQPSGGIGRVRPGSWGAGRGFCPGSSALRKGSAEPLPPEPPPPSTLACCQQRGLCPTRPAGTLVTAAASAPSPLPPCWTHLPPQLGSHRAGRGWLQGQGWRLCWGTQAQRAQTATSHTGWEEGDPPGRQEAQGTQGCRRVGDRGCWCCEGLPTPTQASFLEWGQICAHLGHQAQEGPQDETLPTPAPHPSLFPPGNHHPPQL